MAAHVAAAAVAFRSAGPWESAPALGRGGNVTGDLIGGSPGRAALGVFGTWERGSGGPASIH